MKTPGWYLAIVHIAWPPTNNSGGSRGGGRGGLRVLKHPPKLPNPKVNYLLLLLINCQLTHWIQIIPAKQLYNTAAVSLDEAKELELQARCCAERLELASWSVCTTRPHLQYYHHVMCAEMMSKVGVAQNFAGEFLCYLLAGTKETHYRK